MKSPRPRGQPPKRPKDRLSVRITFNLKPHEALALEKYLKQRPPQELRRMVLEGIARE